MSGGLLGYVGKSAQGDYQPFNYERSLAAPEVEISNDMYIITRETAEVYKKQKEKPPVLTSIVISPADVQLQPGMKQSFVAKGANQYGGEIAIGPLEWKSTGGIIDNEGVFTAGNDEGNFVVTVTEDTVKGSATLTIAKPGRIITPPLPPPPPGVLRWSGEVPPQKWMNFYTKVLSKFAGGKGLKLTLTFEAAPESGISAQKIEETKAALDELGLSPNLEMR